MNRALFFGLLIAAAQIASADVCYNVALPIGSAQAAGTICTNGTLGAITQSDITSWNLTLSNGNAQGSLLDSWTWDSTAANSPSVTLSLFGSATNPLQATSAGLIWDFEDPGPSSYAILDFRNVVGGNTYDLYWYNYDYGFQYLGGSFAYSPNVCCGGQATYGDQLSGRTLYPPTDPAPTPEPASIALLLTTLVATGYGIKARRWQS